MSFIPLIYIYAYFSTAKLNILDWPLVATTINGWWWDSNSSSDNDRGDIDIGGGDGSSINDINKRTMPKSVFLN